MFAIQFLNTGEVWLMVKPENISDIVEYLNTGKCEKPETLDLPDVIKPKVKKVISGSKSGRELFHEEQNKMYDKTKWANRR